MAGAKNGVLAHSQSFSVKRILINGREVGEIGQVAAIAGHFDIPVIMLAGDQAACEEILTLQPKAITVAVKRLAGRASTLSLSHEEARRQIEEAVRKVVGRVTDYAPWKIGGPIEMSIEYLPQPPVSLETGPAVPGPDPTSIYIPGSWVRTPARKCAG